MMDRDVKLRSFQLSKLQLTYEEDVIEFSHRQKGQILFVDRKRTSTTTTTTTTTAKKSFDLSKKKKTTKKSKEAKENNSYCSRNSDKKSVD